MKKLLMALVISSTTTVFADLPSTDGCEKSVVKGKHVATCMVVNSDLGTLQKVSYYYTPGAVSAPVKKDCSIVSGPDGIQNPCASVSIPAWLELADESGKTIFNAISQALFGENAKPTDPFENSKY